MKIEWTDPRNIIIVAGGIIGLLVMAPKIGDGWRSIDWLIRVPEKAYAAEAKATEVRTDFDEYLAAQDRALVQQQAYVEAQQQFNKQLLAIQKQQVPQPPVPQLLPPDDYIFRELDDSGIWCCNLQTREQCWNEGSWFRCQ